MKYRNKLILDACMIVVFLVLFKYGFTGGLIHEVIGIVLLAGFLLHLCFNRGYLKKIFWIIRNHNTQWKIRLGAFLNILLIFESILMVLSSVMISKDLLSFLNIGGNYALWRLLHVVCAYAMLTAVFVHLVLHWKAITGFISKKLSLKPAGKGWSIGTRAVAAVLAVLTLKASIENTMTSAQIFSSANRYKNVVYAAADVKKVETVQSESAVETVTETVIFETQGSEDEAVQETTISQTEEAAQESLEDYLGKLTCTGCSRHCSLLAPQCGKGAAQQAEATEEYDNSISE